MSDPHESHDHDSPLISFDVEIEVYLSGRQDPIIVMNEVTMSALYLSEVGVSEMMESVLADIADVASRRGEPFIVFRASSGMRQLFWESHVQGLSLLAPAQETIEALIEEAVE